MYNTTGCYLETKKAKFRRFTSFYEGQRYTHKLNQKQTEDMIKLNCQPPNVRANQIRRGVDVLNHQENEYLQRVSNEMTIIGARVLPAPRLHYHPDSYTADIIPKNGAWNMRDSKVATGATLGSWACVVFGNFPLPAVQNFIRGLVNACSDIGMNIPNKFPPMVHGNPHGNIKQILRQAWLKAGNMARSSPQIILCVLPNPGVPKLPSQ